MTATESRIHKFSPVAKARDGTSKTLLHGLGWNYACSLASILLTLSYTAFTGRVVDNGRYGAYAIALTLSQCVSHIACAGLYTHLLRVAQVTWKLLKAAWKIGLLSGTACSLATLLAAPLCATLWKIPAVEPALQLLACQFLFHPAATIANAALRRAGRQKHAAGSELIGLAAGFSGGTLLLSAGWNPWGLAVVPPITGAVTLIVATVCLTRARRRLEAGSPVPCPELLKRSVGLSLHNLVDFVTSNAPLWWVARLLGSTQAGFYSRAWMFASMPRAILAQGISFTTTPIMADRKRPGDAPPTHVVHAILCGASAVAFVPFGLLAALGPPVLDLLLGPGWGPAVGLVPVLAAGSAVSLLCAVGSSVDQVRSASRSLAWTKVAVIGGMAGAVTAAVATRSLTVFAVAALPGPALGHAVQLLHWRRHRVVRVRELLRAHLTHAAIGAVLFASARLPVTGQDPVAALAYGCAATLTVMLACYLFRTRLPFYAVAKRHVLLGVRPDSSTLAER